MSALAQVTITAPDVDWLKAFVRQLVSARLCAAAHLDTIQSTYWWDNQINERDEGRATLHTRAGLVPDIIELANTEHPYVVPCVAVSPLTDGNPRYLDWITAETRQQ